MAEYAPPKPSEIADEFKNAIKLSNFHRYAIAVDGVEVTAYFGLVGEDGSHNYYCCDVATLIGVQSNLTGLVIQSQELEKGNGLKAQAIPFETSTAFVVTPATGGHLLFFFSTLANTQLFTAIKPEVAAIFAASLRDALSSLPVPPKLESPIFDVRVKGDEHTGETVEYFGQKYQPDLLQAFGVLMIRAGLLDKSLVKLLCVLSGMSMQQAESAFYSTVSYKARTDLIKAIRLHAPIPEDLKQDIQKILDKANDIAGRRNDLVHSVWSFEKDGFTVENYKPNTKKGKTSVAVSAQTILEIAEAYLSVGVSVETVGLQVFNHTKNIAKNAASTPADGSPSS